MIVETLAIDGGTPIREGPMPPRIQIGEGELDAVTEVFRRRMRDGGAFDRYDSPEVDTYEKELAAYFGVRYVTCVSSGTAAIHASLAALDLDPGTEVIVSSFTDPGSVMTVLLNQCVPVFAEHDFDTFLMSVEGVRRAISRHTGAIILAQLHGYVCDMDGMRALASEYHLPLIGDVSQSHGSTYQGSRATPLGDIGTMSLMSGKHMVAGGQGGFVGTNVEAIHWSAKRFADRGKPFGQLATSNTGLGLNYRMTELEAAIGRVQLQRLEGIRSRRIDVLRTIQDGIHDLDMIKPVKAHRGVEINPWYGLFLLDPTQLSTDNAGIAAAMVAEGIPVEHSYRSAINYELEYFTRPKTRGTSGWPFGTAIDGRHVDRRPPDNPTVERIARSLLLLGLHECWTEKEADQTVRAFHKVLTAYRV